jgi:hypothetical protein
MYPNIERRLGLHESVGVIYVVDGYEAALVHENQTVIAEAKGETVEEALANLELLLKPEGT